MIIRRFVLLCFLSIGTLAFCQDDYEPGPENVEARKEFQNEKFGMFIHFGLYSELGRGEWVMNNDSIPFKDYKKLADFFDPVDFDAEKIVGMAKDAGVKYITLVTRHHDGFSMWDTKYSDFNIMHTPYGKDLVKELTEEAHRQGIKMVFYYSLLDWGRDDYSYWTGRTGKGTGRDKKGNWDDYIEFMKNQLTELLTNYGDIAGIWFDGYWDQMEEEQEDRSNKTYVDWKMDEIYALIHRLQPQCLIGNNHHLTPLPGEDFQMFERDLPGQNEHGLSFQEISDLPLETAATMNDSWGFNLTDDNTKSFEEFVDLLVRAAGSNANLLMNVGPLPNGKIPEDFVERFEEMGDWMAVYGESIYDTRGGYQMPEDGVAITKKDDKMYIHILEDSPNGVVLDDFPSKDIKRAYLLKDESAVDFDLKDNQLQLKGDFTVDADEPDVVIVLKKVDS